MNNLFTYTYLGHRSCFELILILGIGSFFFMACGDDTGPVKSTKSVVDTNSDFANPLCPVGQETCSCTQGGACDSGFSCRSGICVALIQSDYDTGGVSFAGDGTDTQFEIHWDTNKSTGQPVDSDSLAHIDSDLVVSVDSDTHVQIDTGAIQFESDSDSITDESDTSDGYDNADDSANTDDSDDFIPSHNIKISLVKSFDAGELTGASSVVATTDGGFVFVYALGVLPFSSSNNQVVVEKYTSAFQREFHATHDTSNQAPAIAILSTGHAAVLTGVLEKNIWQGSYMTFYQHIYSHHLQMFDGELASIGQNKELSRYLFDMGGEDSEPMVIGYQLDKPRYLQAVALGNDLFVAFTPIVPKSFSGPDSSWEPSEKKLLVTFYDSNGAELATTESKSVYCIGSDATNCFKAARIAKNEAAHFSVYNGKLSMTRYIFTDRTLKSDETVLMNVWNTDWGFPWSLVRSDGGFTLVWNTESGVMAKVFSSNSEALGDAVLLTASQASNVMAMDDGRFLLMASEDSQIFTENFSPVTGVFEMPDCPNMSRLTNGEIVCTGTGITDPDMLEPAAYVRIYLIHNL